MGGWASAAFRLLASAAVAWLPHLKDATEIQAWRFCTEGPLEGTPVAHPSNPVVFTGSHDYNVYAVNAETGVEVWRFTTGGLIHGSLKPGVNARTIYAGSQDANLYAINADTGKLQWKFALRRSLRSSPAFSADDGGIVYAAADQLYAVRTSDGTQAWAFNPKGDMTADLAVSGTDGRIFFSTWNGTAYASTGVGTCFAVDGMSGKELWRKPGCDALFQPGVSPRGDVVYVHLIDPATDKRGTLAALSADTGKTLWATRLVDADDGPQTSLGAAMAISMEGDVAYVGATDFRVYAISTKDGRVLWSHPTRYNVKAPPVLGDGVVYVGSMDHSFYALNATTGKTLWTFKTGALIQAAAAVNGSAAVYVASYDYCLYRLQAPVTLRRTNWGLVALMALAALWLLTAAAALLPGARRRKGVVVPYLLAGVLFGCACGGLLSYLTVILPSALQASRTFSEDHLFRRWFRTPPPESLLTLAATLAMGGAWAAAAWRRWAGLDPLCSWAVLVLSLVAAANLVPSWWIMGRALSGADELLYEGSIPRTQVAWVVASYPVALAVLVFGAVLLEGLLWGLDRITTSWPRWWRHLYLRLTTLLPAFHAGFLACWTATAMALYIFNRHGQYVPPFSPLSLVGVLVGTCTYLRLLLRQPPRRHKYVWARERAAEAIAFLQHWRPQPKAAGRVLLSWDMLCHTHSVHRELTLGRIASLTMNACCPRELRARLPRILRSRTQLGSSPGCHSSIADELDWNLVVFAVVSSLAVLPLIAFWGYQRFSPATSRVLTLQPQVEVSWYAGIPGRSEFSPNKTFPLPVVPGTTPSYEPLVFQDSVEEPFERCDHSKLGSGGSVLDPGDFRLCLTDKVKRMLLLNDPMTMDIHLAKYAASCRGVATTILAEPSRSLWFNMQAVVYAGFLLFVLWVVSEEAEEKRYVSVALIWGRLFREEEAGWRACSPRAVTRLLSMLWLLVLGSLYMVCLWRDGVEERFFIMGWHAFRNYYVDALGPDPTLALRDILSKLEKGTVLAWVCGAFLYEKKLVEGFQAAYITYSSYQGQDLSVAIIQAGYFLFQCVALQLRQGRIYDFVNPDVLLTRHLESEAPERECSYWSIHQVRESGEPMTRADVDELLCGKVYIPILRRVSRHCPGLLEQLFPQQDVAVLHTLIKEEKEECMPGSWVIEDWWSNRHSLGAGLGEFSSSGGLGESAAGGLAESDDDLHSLPPDFERILTSGLVASEVKEEEEGEGEEDEPLSPEMLKRITSK